jgi:transcriptional regulator with PAS, ATPase and Fis domain
MYSSANNTIYKEDLPFHPEHTPQTPGKELSTTLKTARSRAQAETIYQALARTNYNKAKAAKLLGIHRTLLYKKMKEYKIGLKPERFPGSLSGS